jgi:hypothetical protein
MTTDYRALCAELLAAIQLYTKLNPAAYEMSASELTGKLMDVMAATTAALAQLEPEGPPMPVPGDAEGLAEVFWGRYDQPEPVAPTDEQWDALKERVWDAYQTIGYQGERFMYDSDFDTALDVVRHKLARWGTPAIEPVPVSERLPEVGDWVWHCYVGVRFWEHGRYNGRQFFIGDGPESQPATHWLSANALPTPEAANA